MIAEWVSVMFWKAHRHCTTYHMYFSECEFVTNRKNIKYLSERNHPVRRSDWGKTSIISMPIVLVHVSKHLNLLILGCVRNKKELLHFFDSITKIYQNLSWFAYLLIIKKLVSIFEVLVLLECRSKIVRFYIAFFNQSICTLW